MKNFNQFSGSNNSDILNSSDVTLLVEGSGENKFKIGDRVYISSEIRKKRKWSFLDKRLNCILDEPGTIIDIVEEKEFIRITSNRYIIKFDKELPELQSFFRDEQRDRFNYGFYSDLVREYLNNTDETNIWLSNGNDLVKIDDLENTNYEEWVEESTNNKYYVGQIGVLKNVGHSNFDGRIIKLLNLDNESSIKILEIKGPQQGQTYGLCNLKELDKYFEPQDEPEEQNYEEWNESIKKDIYEVGDRVIYFADSYDPPFRNLEGKKGTVTEKKLGYYIIRFDDNFTEEEKNIYKKRNSMLPWKSWTVGSNDIRLIDSPEESDFEEWVEESTKDRDKRLDSMIGRRIVSKRTQSDAHSGKVTGTIIGYVSSYSGGNGLYYLVKFDEQYHIQRPVDVYDKESAFNSYTYANLPFDRKESNCDWIDGRDDYFTILDDEPEETNYEEWNESNNYHYVVGDRVKILSSECNNYVNPMIGTTGVVVGMLTGSSRYAVKFDTTNKEVLDYLIDSDNNHDFTDQIRKAFEFFGTHNMYFFHPNELELVDDLEETNYEEWNESNQFKEEGPVFKVGDVVRINNNSYWWYPTEELRRKEGQIPDTGTVTHFDLDEDYETMYYVKWGEKDSESNTYYDHDLELVEEKPEESDREEWVEESKLVKLDDIEVGDTVFVKHGKYKGKTGKAISKAQVWDEDFYLYHKSFNITFKDGTSGVVEGFRLKKIDEPEDSNMEEWVEEGKNEEWEKIKRKIYFGDDDLPQVGDTIIDYKGNRVPVMNSVWCEYDKVWCLRDEAKWDDKGGFYYIPSEEEYEEEWVEESIEHRFKVGDMVKGKRGQSSDKIRNKIFRITDIDDSGYNQILYLQELKTGENEDGWYSYRFDLVEDKPEESNMEEWLEESKNIQYKVGDRVKIKKDLKDDKYYGGMNFTSEMSLLCGEYANIVELLELGGKTFYYINLGPNYLKWSSEMFEGDEPEETNYEEWNEKRIIKYEEF